MKKRDKLSEDFLRNPKIILKTIDRSLKNYPNDLGLLWLKSVQIQGKDNKEALRLAEYVAEKDPNDFYAFQQIADVHRETRSYRKAINANRKVIEVLKGLIACDKSRKQIKYHESEIRDARKKIKEFESRLAGTYKEKPMSKEFLAMRRANRKKHKNDLSNLRYESWGLEEKGKLKESMKLAERMISLYEDLPYGYMQAGDLYKIMKKYDLAYDYYQRAIHLIKMHIAWKTKTNYEGELEDLIQDIKNEIKEIPAQELKKLKSRKFSSCLVPISMINSGPF